MQEGISIVVRRNAGGRIYGITFIDHNSRSVWNGSELGKNLSANVFNDWWNNGSKADLPQKADIASEKISPAEELIKVPHSLPAVSGIADMPESGQDSNIFEAFGSLLPQAQGEDFQETAFANQMKRKANRRKPKF